MSGTLMQILFTHIYVRFAADAECGVRGVGEGFIDTGFFSMPLQGFLLCMVFE